MGRARWRKRAQRLALWSALVALSAMPAWRAGATGRGLRGVAARIDGTQVFLEVDLDFSFHYETHSPPTAGSVLEIRVRATNPDELDHWRGGDSLVWSGRDQIPLRDVDLRSGLAPGSAVVRLSFERSVAFRVSQSDDLHTLEIQLLDPAGAGPEAPAPAATAPIAPQATAASTAAAAPGDRVDEIIAQGRAAMLSGDLQRAVLLFTAAMENPDHPRAPEAKELLGLAYQRRGKWAHARAEYEDYLARYPDSDGAPRVRQRLESLLTAATAERPASQRPRKPERSRFEHDWSGGIANYYRENRIADGNGSSFTSTGLDSDAYFSSRHRNQDHSIRTSFSAGNSYDPDGGSSNSEDTRISSAFVDWRAYDDRFTSRLGRQSASGGGILGRYDGLEASYLVHPFVRLKVSSGFLVDFAQSNRIGAERPFLGVRSEFGPFNDHWDGEMFAIRQQIDGIEDRTAVGAQMRYSSQQGFVLGIVDYDIGFDTLSSAMFIANWNITDRTSVNTYVDIRRSPALTTYNALQGQPVQTIDEMLDTFSESEVRDMALARSARARTVTLGAAHQLDSTWQLSGDVTLSNLSLAESTPSADPLATQVIEGTPATGNEYYVALRAGAVNLLLEGSFTNFGVRYSKGSTMNRYQIGLGGRYPTIERLRMGPEVSLEYRDADVGPNVWSTRLGIRFEYRWQALNFDLLTGVEIDRGTANDAQANERELFVFGGYRYDF